MLGCAQPSAESGAGGGESKELRARIEQLKQDVAATATSADNAIERSGVLWEWTNAFALAGGVVPVNLTTVAAGTARARASIGEVPEGGSEEIDRYVRELALKEADPKAIGAIVASPAGPLAAGSYVTIEQTYTVGTKPMAVGGVVLVARQLSADQGLLQNQDAGGDNYVTVRTGKGGASFEAIQVPYSGMHGGFRGAEPLPAFRLAGAQLEPGDTVTVVYGDTSGGSKGFRLQSFSTDQLLLPLYLDLDASGDFLTPRWPAIRVEGGAVEGVSAIAPSVVASGERFALRVRSEDRHWNRATGPKPGYTVLLDGREIATIPAAGDAAAEALATVPDLKLERPGVYRIEVRSTGDGPAIATVSNPIWVRDAPERRIFWGETHGHTGLAEGQGSPGHFWTWARDDARLDFAGLSEHDIWLDDAEWAGMQELARETTSDGSFAAYLGYEWTSPRALGGHHNVFFRTPDRTRVGVQVAPTLPELYRGLHASAAPEDSLVIPHAHQAADWTQSDAELERLVEIYSMHGSFDWFGNMYLKSGFQVGFVAASDDHRARPGYAHGYPRGLPQRGGLAAVAAAEHTTDAIFDALRELRSYATSGQRTLLDATLNGQPMGSRQPDAERRELVAEVAGTAAIDQIDVIKNGEIVWSKHYLGAPLRSRSWVQVAFESSSDTLGERDNPRGYRLWEGTIEVEGARVMAVRRDGLDNLYNESVAIDPESPQRVRFRVETRGRKDSLLLDLDGASASTTLSVHLDASREFGVAPVPVRRPAEIPGEDLRLQLSGLVDGRLERELRVDEHVDVVRLQVVDLGAPLDQSVTFTDMDPPQPGDYYYLRVTQVDGARAWSSPFWVGERPAAAASAGGDG